MNSILRVVTLVWHFIVQGLWLVGAGLLFTIALHEYRRGDDFRAGFDLALGLFAVGMAVSY
jgi:hypothetical protein